MVLSVLNLMKALWQGAGQYTHILEWLRTSENFWKKMSNYVLFIAGIEDPPIENLNNTEALDLACKYRCQSAILEIMAYEMFLQKKLSHADSLLKHAAQSKDRTEYALAIQKSAVKDIMADWCESSVLGKLIKSHTSCEYNNNKFFHVKVNVIYNFIYFC